MRPQAALAKRRQLCANARGSSQCRAPVGSNQSRGGRIRRPAREETFMAAATAAAAAVASSFGGPGGRATRVAPPGLSGGDFGRPNERARGRELRLQLPPTACSGGHTNRAAVESRGARGYSCSVPASRAFSLSLSRAPNCTALLYGFYIATLLRARPLSLALPLPLRRPASQLRIFKSRRSIHLDKARTGAISIVLRGRPAIWLRLSAVSPASQPAFGGPLDRRRPKVAESA